jgi:hypothetical protein
MQGLIASDESRRLDGTQTDLQAMNEYGVRELDVTLIRPTNYTDDGYPIKTRIGVIRSNTLTQVGTLVHDLVNHPFFKGVSLIPSSGFRSVITQSGSLKPFFHTPITLMGTRPL